MRSKELLAILGLALAGCVQKMGTEGHLRPYDGTDLGPAARPIPEGTVPQSAETVSRPALYTRAHLERGRDLYGAFCLPCHGPSGYGNGMVVQRGFLAPPSYHEERLRKEDDDDYFEVITNGKGAMYGYGDRVAPADRWAIIAYLRALQRSQHARLSDLTGAERRKLEGAP